jgi:hypothetical protein
MHGLCTSAAQIDQVFAGRQGLATCELLPWRIQTLHLIAWNVHLTVHKVVT